MKPTKVIALIILFVFLTAWSVKAHEPHIGNGIFGTTQLSMIIEQLELTDEQTAAVQDILATSKEAMEKIGESHGLQRGDMRKVHREMKKFREQYPEKLAAILDHEQLQALHKEIFANGPFRFMQLPEEEALASLQNLLWLSKETANQVAAILEDGKMQHVKILEDLGLNPALMMAFQQDMATCRKEMAKSLSEVLSENQMKKFEELRNQMKLRNRDLTIHSWIRVNCYDA